MNNKIDELNNTLLNKSGSLSISLAKSISESLKGLSKKDLKVILADIDSNMMLNRLFTSSFINQEFEICFAIKEILEERQLLTI